MSAAGNDFPWERAAMRGLPLPEGLPLPDQMAYLALRGIYRACWQGSLRREEAVGEKLLVRRAYQRARAELAFQDRLAAHRVHLLRTTERARADCRREPTAAHALRLCDALEGIALPPDESSS